MPWALKAVEAPASAIKTPLEEIPADVAAGVEEAFKYGQDNPTERLVLVCKDEDDRDIQRALIRSYCELRPEGRLTASIWAVTVDPETGETSKEAGSVPALSMFFRVYVKKAKGTATDGNGQAQDEGSEGSEGASE